MTSKILCKDCKYLNDGFFSENPRCIRPVKLFDYVNGEYFEKLNNYPLYERNHGECGPGAVFFENKKNRGRILNWFLNWVENL